MSNRAFRKTRVGKVVFQKIPCRKGLRVNKRTLFFKMLDGAFKIDRHTFVKMMLGKGGIGGKFFVKIVPKSDAGRIFSGLLDEVRKA